MTTYFKAIRPGGTSFADPSFMWATLPGGVTTHAAPVVGSTDVTDYLSVATAATDCTGFRWPCRLLVVEPVGETWVPDGVSIPNKVAGAAFRTVRELPASQVFGKYADQIVQILERCGRLTVDELKDSAARYAAWDAARYAAWDAAWYAARDATRDAACDAALYAAWDATRDAACDAALYAARDAAWYAARDAALAWLTKDLITDERFATLTEAWDAVRYRAWDGESNA
jgi:hypothetical protein